MHFKDFITNKDYSQFVDELSEICKKKNYQLKVIGHQRNFDIYSIVVNADAKKTLGIVGTVHGEEPASGLGALNYLRWATVPKNVRLFIIPILNPWGYENNKRRNVNNRNINRQFFKKRLSGEAKVVTDALAGIDFLLTLHEDDRYNTYYLYYSDAYNENKYKKIVETAKKYFKINDQRFISGDRAKDGMIYVPRTNRKWNNIATLEYWAFRQGIHYVCSETPSKGQPLGKRIDCNKAIMSCVTNHFLSFI